MKHKAIYMPAEKVKAVCSTRYVHQLWRSNANFAHQRTNNRTHRNGERLWLVIIGVQIEFESHTRNILGADRSFIQIGILFTVSTYTTHTAWWWWPAWQSSPSSSSGTRVNEHRILCILYELLSVYLRVCVCVSVCVRFKLELELIRERYSTCFLLRSILPLNCFELMACG